MEVRSRSRLPNRRTERSGTNASGGRSGRTGVPHRARTPDEQSPGRSATHTCEPRLGQPRTAAARREPAGRAD
eukprot:scaffold86938_cov60-Phaeocystis_antarctica.AAC.2